VEKKGEGEGEGGNPISAISFSHWNKEGGDHLLLLSGERQGGKHIGPYISTKRRKKKLEFGFSPEKEGKGSPPLRPCKEEISPQPHEGGGKKGGECFYYRGRGGGRKRGGGLQRSATLGALGQGISYHLYRHGGGRGSALLPRKRGRERKENPSHPPSKRARRGNLRKKPRRRERGKGFVLFF